MADYNIKGRGGQIPDTTNVFEVEVIRGDSKRSLHILYLDGKLVIQDPAEISEALELETSLRAFMNERNIQNLATLIDGASGNFQIATNLNGQYSLR